MIRNLMFFLHQHYRASYLTSEIHMIHMEFHRNHIMPVGPQWPGPGPGTQRIYPQQLVLLGLLTLSLFLRLVSTNNEISVITN